MSTAGISFGGLASGLDTQAIISALLAIEERPIRALEQKKTSITRQKSLFGDLDGLLDKLTSAAKALKTTGSFLQMTAASDDESVLTARADSSATPGTYAVEVWQRAKAQVNSAGAASRTDPIGGQQGIVEIQLDVDGQSYAISADNNLDAIAAAINAENAANGTGVRAEVIDTGNPVPAERYQLVVRGAEPGVDNAFTLSYVDGGPAFQAFVDDLNTGGQAAQNARLDLDGITIERSTNSIGDLFGGITLELKSVSDPGTDVTITVATDGEETAKKVKDFVDAYNAVVGFFTTQNALDAEGKASSPLFGDSTLRSMRSSLRTVVGGVVTTTGNPAYQMLSQIGVKADTQGKLEFDQQKFIDALNDDEQAVARMFTDAAGFAARLEEQIDVYTDSVDGLIKARNDGFDRLVKQTQGRIDQAERRLTLYEQQLTAKYANLETLLGRLQSQGSSLGALNFNFGA